MAPRRTGARSSATTPSASCRHDLLPAVNHSWAGGGACRRHPFGRSASQYYIHSQLISAFTHLASTVSPHLNSFHLNWLRPIRPGSSTYFVLIRRSCSELGRFTADSLRLSSDDMRSVENISSSQNQPTSVSCMKVFEEHLWHCCGGVFRGQMPFSNRNPI